MKRLSCPNKSPKLVKWLLLLVYRESGGDKAWQHKKIETVAITVEKKEMKKNLVRTCEV